MRREDGKSVSAQYIHDIERDRRVPSPFVLGEIARALGDERYYLAALAGHCPPEIIDYLRGHSDLGPSLAAIFALADEKGFREWEQVAALIV